MKDLHLVIEELDTELIAVIFNTREEIIAGIKALALKVMKRRGGRDISVKPYVDYGDPKRILFVLRARIVGDLVQRFGVYEVDTRFWDQPATEIQIPVDLPEPSEDASLGYVSAPGVGAANPHTGPHCPLCGVPDVVQLTATGPRGELLHHCQKCECQFDIHPRDVDERGLVVDSWEWCGDLVKDLEITYTNGQRWLYTNVEIRPGETEWVTSAGPVTQNFQFSYVSRTKEE